MVFLFVSFAVLAVSVGAYVPGNEIVADAPKKHPVIFVPGDGGCQLQGKLNKPSSVHFFCSKTTNDYFTLWLSLEELAPLLIDCWVDNVKLNYNATTRTTYNQPGVDIIVPGFGDPETVEWLDPIKLSIGAYFKDIGNALVGLGYERKVNIHGAPFDFRKAPNELKDYFAQLKNLVEQTYKVNGNKSAVLIGHSMGAPMSMYFLQQQSKAWKAKYIKSLITLSGAYAGSMKTVKAYLMGDNLNVVLLPEGTLRGAQVTLPSLAWLMPSPYFWKPTETLVTTPQKNYSLGNMDEFFKDLNLPTSGEIVKDQMKYRDFSPPDVEVHCLYGTGSQTLDKIVYTDKLGGTHKFINSDGDGTVGLRSLQACKSWRDHQKPQVVDSEVPGATHNGILSDARVISYITKYLQSIN